VAGRKKSGNGRKTINLPAETRRKIERPNQLVSRILEGQERKKESPLIFHGNTVKSAGGG